MEPDGLHRRSWFEFGVWRGAAAEVGVWGSWLDRFQQNRHDSCLISWAPEMQASWALGDGLRADQDLREVRASTLICTGKKRPERRLPR